MSFSASETSNKDTADIDVTQTVDEGNMATKFSPTSASKGQQESANGPSILIIGEDISSRLAIMSILSNDIDEDDEIVFLDKPTSANQSASGKSVVKTAYWRGDHKKSFTIFLFENEDNLAADVLNIKQSINAVLILLEDGVQPNPILRSTINVLEAVFGQTFWEHLIVISPKWPCQENCQEDNKYCKFQFYSHKEQWNAALQQWFPKLDKEIEIYCLNNVSDMGLEGSVHNDTFHKKLLNRMCFLLWINLQKKKSLRNLCAESLSLEKDALTSKIQEMQKNENILQRKVVNLSAEVKRVHEEMKAKKLEKDKLLQQKDVEILDINRQKSDLDNELRLVREEADTKTKLVKEEKDELRMNFKIMEEQVLQLNYVKGELNHVKASNQQLQIDQAVLETQRDMEKQRADVLQRKIDDMNKEQLAAAQQNIIDREKQLLEQREEEQQKREAEHEKRTEQILEKFPALCHPDTDGNGTLGDALKQHCSPIEIIGSHIIFKVPLEKNGVIKDDDDKIVARKYFLPGVKNNDKATETILVLGMTGAGKSTFLDASTNFVLDIRLTDDHRFKLVELTEEEANKQKDQAVSQTDTICVYELEWQEGFNIPYNLVIIDTPGFCDTRGIDRDKQLQKDLKHVFNKNKGGVEAINAVCFIIKASDARFTAEQQFMYESVFGIFGYDIEGNIFAVLTHDDGQEPAALHALNKAEMPYSMHFVCNSKAVFAGLQIDDGNFSMNDVCNFQRLYDNCNEFFKQLTYAEKKSMELSTTVMEHRERIEAEIEGLQTHVKRLLHKKDILRQEKAICDQHNLEISANENFIYEVEEVKIVEVKLNPGTHVTNCLECNFTCHYPCYIPNNEDKAGCAAMRNGSCYVCAQKCHWSTHRNTGFRIDTETEKVTKTYEEVKQKYEDYLEKHKGQKSVVDAIEYEAKNLSEQIQDHIQRIADCLYQVSLIELKPKRHEVKEYIDRMIQSEEQAQKSGYLARIGQLKLERQRAEQLQKIQEGGSWDELGITVPGVNKESTYKVVKRRRVRKAAAGPGHEEYRGYQRASSGFGRGRGRPMSEHRGQEARSRWYRNVPLIHWMFSNW